jgi:hypothetical protein
MLEKIYERGRAGRALAGRASRVGSPEDERHHVHTPPTSKANNNANTSATRIAMRIIRRTTQKTTPAPNTPTMIVIKVVLIVKQSNSSQ